MKTMKNISYHICNSVTSSLISESVSPYFILQFGSPLLVLTLALGMSMLAKVLESVSQKSEVFSAR